MQNFLSPYFNRREDDWGGNAENRQRFALAVIDEVMQTIKTHATRPFLLGMRLSPEESVAGGLRLGDYYPLVEALIAKGIDYLHLSPPQGLLTMHPKNQIITPYLLEKVAGRVPVIATGACARRSKPAKRFI